MVFFRTGPRLLFLHAREPTSRMTDYLVSREDGQIVSVHEGLDRSTEESSLCFVTEPQERGIRMDRLDAVVLVRCDSSVLLSRMVNARAAELVEQIELGPTSLVFRFAGEEQDIIDRLATAFDARVVSWEEALEQGGEGETILSLTRRAIGARLSEVDLCSRNLLIPESGWQVRRKLRTNGLLFITESLASHEWEELRISVYDAHGRYEKHYERLTFILSRLEVGMILGEGWSRDHALAMLMVLTYQIRLFTLMTPEQIKEILLGLEYDDEGERIVDLDLYHRNKKVPWGAVGPRGRKRRKEEEGRQHRARLLERLSTGDRAYLRDMERRIRESA